MVMEPYAILDRRTVKRQNKAVTQLLVHWQGSLPEDATWEFAYDLQKRFPQFDISAQPWGQGPSDGGGIDTQRFNSTSGEHGTQRFDGTREEHGDDHTI
ncbi:hypothetical protein COLO4_28993 [Corchorus olitorius]|uniref:Chromo domain-containing protein n=1 Tax=Corchorus olitorius TaxID=93759 RepID=A0A1R3HH37_9ROSI|nr:hypothetical protein COLO4_28993 [Corchorus olitorius]